MRRILLPVPLPLAFPFTFLCLGVGREKAKELKTRDVFNTTLTCSEILPGRRHILKLMHI